MAKTIDRIKVEMASITEEQTAILDKADKENRKLTAEDERRYSELDAEYAALEVEARYLERNPKVATWLASSQTPPHKPMPPGGFIKNLSELNGKGKRSMLDTKEAYIFNESGTEQRDAFNRFLKYGPSGINEAEYRALAADSDVGGGYLVVPVELAKDILTGLDNELEIRRLARTFPLPNADSLGVPTLGDDFGDLTFTAELATGTEDSNLDLQRRDLHPHPMARRIKVSNKLLRVSQMNPEAFVRDRMIQVCGQVLENAYLNGNGVNKPLGMFVASVNGIDTDRDYSADNTATQVKADNLIGAVGMLKSQYRRGAVWIAHRDFETQVRKLKDGEGNYLWKAGLEAAGNTLLGFPLVLSEYAPNTFASGNYVAVLANLAYYWIADALSMQITRLTELYAETNQTGFIIRHETDGMPVWSDAFVRIKLG